ncbi:hypothetical protein JXB12_05155 [candidate division KSB1 bacterium]|nr:hypothetical protein [candidate division KSB1 bacterium]
MKKLLLLLCVIIVTTSLSAQDSTSIEQVKVYYFHTSYRCVNCTNFENWTSEVVKTRFPNELKKDLVSFESINIDEKDNKKYIETYQLVTKSVILQKIKDKKEIEWKNLDQIWLKARDEKKFKDYIESEIKSMLKGNSK